MKFIDEKFKDRKPAETVKFIKDILQKNGIEVCEKWYESGIENCFSLSLSANGGIPSANGKGITKELAQASAYGEFIERLQGGLFFYKYQSITRNQEFNSHSFAPDVKYMTLQELEESGEWMDYIIEEYKHPLITKNSLTNLAKVYDLSAGDTVLTLPFYSLFEDKYVYLPMGFVDQIYATNGCCVGNTKEEAWVHACSEILERNASLRMLLSGKSAPKFSDSVINNFPTVKNIVNKIREKGHFEVDIFDYSNGSGFPIVSTRIINKKSHTYHINVAADPVFEIALQRTLTESFQGRNIDNFSSRHDGSILNKVSDFPKSSNITNQLETGNGLFTADYFANELTCKDTTNTFVDNSNKTNKELLEYVLGIFKKIGKPVYVRNFSFLGFPCYRFVVPGFSEAYYSKLGELVPEYAIADDACKAMKSPLNSTTNDLAMFLAYNNSINMISGRYFFFGRLSGIPLTGPKNTFLACITRSYASYKLNDFSAAIKHLNHYLKSANNNDETKEYFDLVKKYLELKKSGIDEEKIKSILYKFFEEKYFNKFYSAINNNTTPYDEYLPKCNYTNCDKCNISNDCLYQINKAMNIRIGKVYQSFVKGQDRSEFSIPRS